MSKTNHKGTKPKELVRPKVTIDDIDKLLEEVRMVAVEHLQNYGDGIFTHPHEVVGCMFGQLNKLSASADESIYPEVENLQPFRKRCMKLVMPLLNSIISCDVIDEIRRNENDETEDQQSSKD